MLPHGGDREMDYAFEEMDISEFVSNCVKKMCITCGAPLTLNTNGRPRKFCSDACRRKFWKTHPKPELWDCIREMTCPICGRVFYAQNENTRHRKYCSRACANRARGMIGETDEDLRIENPAGIRTQTGGV